VEKWLGRALAARPDLAPALEAVLDAARGRNPALEVRRLHDDEPERFAALATIVGGSYYMNLKIRRRIGYPGQGKRPPYPDEADYDLRDGLLDPVLERGWAAFRQPPPRAVAEVRRAPAEKESPDEGDPRVAPSTANRGERPDVLVVGAGAAGSIATLRLAQAGFRVVCLEQGGWANPSDFPGDKLEWELLVDTRWSPDPNVRRLPADYPLEVSSSPITPIMFNAVGGSTVHFGAQWARMRPSDFKLRSVDGIADDWPLSYEELEPFYERVDDWMQIAGIGGDPAYPPGAPPPLPPLPIGAIGRKAAEGMNELGWHWWPAHHAIRSVAVGSLAACERTGTCMWGCPKGAKGSTDTTLWPEALRLGARLVTDARVRAITTHAGLADGAVYVDREGREHRQEADVVVLACNGIGTPRLLLLSGLANSSGLVGKRLMLHPYMSVLGIYDEPLESWLGPWGTQLLSLQFADTDESRGFPRGAQWDVMPIGGPLMALARWGDLPYEERWGPAVHGLVEKTLGRAFDWGVGIEDLPHESNRVSLDPELADGNGIPAPRITYEIDGAARANLAFQLERAREAHEAAGARETRVTDWSQWGWHLLGTARMGGDPRTSVVDRWGRAHDVANLYVLDGSVFVTSGPMAPTATICANALRCIERLIERAPLQKTPA
jgi:choline dehydrogenase-like flavoprotein